MDLLNRLTAVLLCLILACFTMPMQAQEKDCEPQWSPLGNGVTLGGGGGTAVLALTVFHDRTAPALYAGGDFGQAGRSPASNIARWDSTAWSPLGAGLIPDGAGTPVRSLLPFDDGTGPSLYAGGFFATAGGNSANCIARWDGVSWSPLGSGMSTPVNALAVFDDRNGPALYAGGTFTQAGDTPANYIAKWDGRSWLALGTGVDQAPVGSIFGISVNALVVFDDGNGPELYAGGNFLEAGGNPASRIAKWDGTAWAPLGTGVNNIVHALAVFDDGNGPALYAGGFFTQAGDSPASRIAKWDGSAWSPLGDGLSECIGFFCTQSVFALTVFDDGSGPALYAGGNFTQAGGSPASYVARWDGSSWSPLGSGASSTVAALTVFDDGSGPSLYAGGLFTSAGGIPASRIAKWQGCPTTAPICLGDIADDFGFTATDGGGPDGVVDFGDFVALLGLIGPCNGGTPGCLGDIADDFGFTAADGGGPDGVVDFGDFVALLGLIGPCPE